MNKKRVWALVAVACAAVLMIAGYLAVTALTKEPEQKEEVIFSAGSIEEIGLTYKGDEMRFKKSGGQWVYADDEAYPLNTAYLRDMSDALLSVVSAGRIESENLTEYGLDKPDCKLTAVTGEGTVFSCALGNKNETANVVYVLYEDEIYTVEQGFSTKFRHTLIEMAAKQQLIDIQPSEAESLLVENSEGTAKFEKTDKGSLPGSLQWEVNGIPADTASISSLIRQMASLKAEECLCYMPDEMTLERYGLKEYAAKAELAYGARSVSAVIGADISDERVAVYLPNNNLICAYSKQDIEPFLRASAEECRNKMLFPAEFSLLEGARIELEGSSKSFDFADIEDSWDFYYKLSTIQADAFADAMPEVSEKTVRITVSMRSGDYVIELVKYDEEFYAADHFGYVQLINKRDVEQLLSISNLVE